MTTFGLNDDEEIKALEWVLAHNKECPFYDDGTSSAPKIGAIGGRLSYIFTPTGLGVITVVKCACGEKIDLTDYDCW